MMRLGIRTRVLLAAMLPVSVASVLLAMVFMSVVLKDIESAERERAHALARQVAAMAEFPLFTGYGSALQAVVNTSMREREVRGVTILDRKEQVVAETGEPVALEALAGASGETRAVIRDLRFVVVQPIYATDIPVDDLFEQDAQAPRAHVLGYVALTLARDDFLYGERVLIGAGVLVTLVGLLFGILLALRLVRAVSKPLLRVIDVVDRFGAGDLDARVRVDAGGPLQALEEGINRMAERIAQHSAELERRVAAATREMREKRDEAEQANAAKSRFLAAASHDLRQPIHALRFFVDGLADEVRGQPRLAALVARMQGSLDATSAMFDALLDISRLDAGVIRADAHDFPVAWLLQRVEIVFSPMAVERGLRYTVVGSRAWVRSDPVLLDRILQNLVANALKYTESGGVLVGCRRRGDRLSIEVWDTGPGIPQEHHEEIFQEFAQLQRPAREPAQGLGLGLAIVRRIARLLEHPLGLRSTPGRGSAFAVEVPRVAPSAERHDMPLPALAFHRFPGVHVALVDDDAAIREAMVDLLRRWGCIVVAEHSSDALLERLEQDVSGIDILICDYRLGRGETGLEVIADICKRLGHHLPTLLITGDTAAPELKATHGSGYYVLHKPVAPAKLRQAMHHLLKRARPPGGNT